MKRQSTTTKITRKVGNLIADSLERGEGVIVRSRGVELGCDDAPLNVQILRRTARSTDELLLHRADGSPIFVAVGRLTILKTTIAALEGEQ